MPIDNRLAESGLGSLERLAWIEVDLKALANNASILSEVAGDASLGVVVKADGYGHGLEASARAVVAGGATYLIVATVSEAVRLRQDGYRESLLVLYPIPTSQATMAAQLGLEVTIGSRHDVERLATTHGAPLEVHLEIDTGMSRGGATTAEALDVASAAVSEPSLKLTGVWSHLFDPDDPAANSAQVAAFGKVIDELGNKGAGGLLRHIDASAGLLARDAPGFDLVRVGLVAYGLAPLRSGVIPSGIRPALALKARAIHVVRLQTGDTVGYGAEWAASRTSTVATLPLGYADGWSRSSVPGGKVQIGDVVTELVGRVSSDAVTVDVTDVAPLDPDDEFTVLGTPTAVAADTVAATRSTISWEVLQQLSGRLARVYLWGEDVIGVRRESHLDVEWVSDSPGNLASVYQ